MEVTVPSIFASSDCFRFDLADLTLEFGNNGANPLHLPLFFRTNIVFTPEEVRRAQFGKFVERGTDVVKELVLLTLPGGIFKALVDAIEIEVETFKPLLSLNKTRLNNLQTL